MGLKGNENEEKRGGVIRRITNILPVADDVSWKSALTSSLQRGHVT